MPFFFKITSRGQKHGGFLLNCAKILDCFVCVLEVLTVRVNFKMESVLGHCRKNSNRKKSKNGKRPLEFLDLSLYHSVVYQHHHHPPTTPPPLSFPFLLKHATLPPLDTHHGKIPDSMMMHWNEGD